MHEIRDTSKSTRLCDITMKDKTVCVVGLGYVGLPLAEAFSRHLKVIGYEIDEEKVKRLSESNNEENTGVPSKIHTRQLVKIQPEERLATTSELNPAPRLVTG
uniref:UDP-N-acetyl-D-mannosamine dehydrogenase n=2 Tax=Candidatus Methanophagaceae archaeon ANME-1 ERB6 TaxID=2759912 RepID=A0A7G9YY45_9EURY|nr:UDP-N-acetyl-D-mannosamine dehydrogenase [Methanosarcinales archaeon ANME-1 ERB6]